MALELSLSNPLVKNFVFYGGASVLKLLAVSPMIVKNRVQQKVFVNAEDVKAFEGKVAISEDVERYRRLHLNDIENIVPFVLLGQMYVLTNPTLSIATNVFRVFFFSRLVHTVAYVAPLPQPTRFLACIAGWGACAYMAVSVVMAAM